MALRGSRAPALARQFCLYDRGIAANHPVATSPLGDIEGLVSSLHQGFAAIAIPRKDGNSQAQREIRDRFAVQQHGLAGHGSADPLGDRHRRPTVGAAQDEHARSWLALRYFELHLLDELGYRPALHNCAGCDTPLRPEENGYSAELGGALCPTCSRYAHRRISLPALKVLRLLQTTEWEALPRLRLDESLQDELEAVMQSSLRFHLDRDLKSWSFLKHV